MWPDSGPSTERVRTSRRRRTALMFSLRTRTRAASRFRSIRQKQEARRAAPELITVSKSRRRPNSSQSHILHQNPSLNIHNLQTSRFTFTAEEQRPKHQLRTRVQASSARRGETSSWRQVHQLRGAPAVVWSPWQLPAPNPGPSSPSPGQLRQRQLDLLLRWTGTAPSSACSPFIQVY